MYEKLKKYQKTLYIISKMKPPSKMFILLWKSLYKSVIEYSSGIYSKKTINS